MRLKSSQLRRLIRDGAVTRAAELAVPAMNRTEAAWADQLRARGPFWFQAVTFKIAHDTRYTPDFMSVIDGRVVFDEVKGFMRDDARVKLYVAARTFPMFTFRLVRRQGGAWRVEEARLLAAMGRAARGALTVEDLVIVHGGIAAVRSGAETVEGAFPVPDAPDAAKASRAEQLAASLKGNDPLAGTTPIQRTPEDEARLTTIKSQARAAKGAKAEDAKE